MNTRYLPVFLAAMIFMVAAAAPVLAHSPYLERGNTDITINSPETSKAYYGWLQGKPAVYSISSKKPFLLYLNLLVPKVDNVRQDFAAKIYKDGKSVGGIYGGDAVWLVAYEPFANDYYNKGPEYETRVAAGNYKIEISNSGNSGNYVLAVGKSEDLSLPGFLRTLAVLPAVKEEFFGKNPWQAYNNFVGLFALIAIAIFAILIYFAASFAKMARLKKRLDNEYKNNGFGRGKNRRPPFGVQGL